MSHVSPRMSRTHQRRMTTGNRATHHDLHADHAIHRPLHQSEPGERVPVLDPARHQRVLAVLAELRRPQPLRERLREPRVRLDAVHVLDPCGVEVVQLVACSRAELEHDAVRGGDERGYGGGVFVIGEIVA